MLRNSNQLKGMAIHATDGELGAIDELYFDDESWGIRYLTVETVVGWAARTCSSHRTRSLTLTGRGGG